MELFRGRHERAAAGEFAKYLAEGERGSGFGAGKFSLSASSPGLIRISMLPSESAHAEEVRRGIGGHMEGPYLKGHLSLTVTGPKHLPTFVIEPKAGEEKSKELFTLFYRTLMAKRAEQARKRS